MRNFTAFYKKELTESVRTYRLLLMLILFFVFGIMNPLTAKITPDLLGALAPEGMSIQFPQPTALDSWMQFFKNISQMGLIVTVIVFSGVLATELSRGTLINMLTKGLSRTAVILAKFTNMAIIWSLCVLVSFLVTWGYTVYLFPGGRFAHLFFSVFCLWVFGVFLLALLLFAATLSASTFGCLLITGGGVTACALLNILPNAYRYNPLSLASRNMDLLTGVLEVQSVLYALVVAAVLSAVFVLSSVLVFRKKQL